MVGFRCVNCGVLTVLEDSKLRPILDEAARDRVRRTISQWIAPLTMTEADDVCDACWNEASKKSAVHRHLCVGCGRSILRKRFHVLNMNSEREYDIYRFINDISLRRHGRDANIVQDHICHACWTRADRARKPRKTTIASSGTSQDSQNAQNIDTSNEEDISGQISLPSYSRAPDTQRRCIFQKCLNTQRKLIPLFIRKSVLIDFNYYISPNTRVCAQHISARLWHVLPEQDNGIKSFTSAHIEEIISWFQDDSRSKKSLDFVDIDKISDEELDCWSGLSIKRKMNTES